jgi:hypothetical protein
MEKGSLYSFIQPIVLIAIQLEREEKDDTIVKIMMKL